MKITQVVFREVKQTNNPELISLVDLVLDDMLKLKDIQLLKSDRGYYIQFPQKKTKDGHYFEIFHCVNHSLRNQIFKEIMYSYSMR
jgi:DNA-binding cell septation regulator SpoVG